MALMDFVKKQFIDIIEWMEAGDGTLAWRFPMADREIQNGASLTVRESQMAVFVNEGKVADVFGPGMYKLTTQTLPVLTYLKNWDKLFQSPFKSDVYFFSTRQQLDRRWGTSQPITIRDKDFGAVRLRAFGNYAYRIADPKLFHTEISGTRDTYTVQDLDGQLRGLDGTTLTMWDGQVSGASQNIKDLAVCGDGVIQGPTEVCDDGDEASSDGCSATCALEACGDGNVVSGDGCSATCTVEPFYVCEDVAGSGGAISC